MCIKHTSKRRAGFTLSELLVALGLSAIVMTVVASLSLYSGRSFSALANYVDLDAVSRQALDRLTYEIRQTKKLDSYAPTSLTFTDYDDGKLSYTYDPDARTLTRDKNGATSLLLKECESLTFQIFQRNPIGGTYEQFPAATPATAKLIEVTWTCSRSVFAGRKENTESVQTAKIVIRNQ